MHSKPLGVSRMCKKGVPLFLSIIYSSRSLVLEAAHDNIFFNEPGCVALIMIHFLHRRKDVIAHPQSILNFKRRQLETYHVNTNLCMGIAKPHGLRKR